jgi:hypothetical protein
MRHLLLNATLIALLGVQPALAQETANLPLLPAATTALQTSSHGALPKGTEVRFALLDTVSSATAKNHQTVRFVVVQDVKEGDLVAIPRGTPVIGEVKLVRKSIPGKRNAYLDLEPRTILLSNGTKLKVQQTANQENCKAEPSCWVAYGLMASIEALFLPVDLTALAVHSIQDKHTLRHPEVRGDFERGPCEIIAAYTSRNLAIANVPSPLAGTTSQADATNSSTETFSVASRHCSAR